MTLTLSKFGRCDSKCYNAEHAECDCICGGSNHRKGLRQAQQNTRELAERMVKEWKQKHPGDKIDVPANQEELF